MRRAATCHPNRPSHARGLCQQCYYAANKERWHAYYAIRKEEMAIERLRRDYGLSVLEYDSILAAQGGVCKICGTANPGRQGTKRFSVDHDHATSKVRGLLCKNCNAGLGNFRDDLSILDSARLYLQGAV